LCGGAYLLVVSQASRQMSKTFRRKMIFGAQHARFRLVKSLRSSEFMHDPHLPAEALTSFANQFLQKLGCSPSVAQKVAEHLVDADLCGVYSHGVFRLTQYAEQARYGRFDPSGEPDLTSADGGGSLVVGNRGLAFLQCVSRRLSLLKKPNPTAPPLWVLQMFITQGGSAHLPTMPRMRDVWQSYWVAEGGKTGSRLRPTAAPRVCCQSILMRLESRVAPMDQLSWILQPLPVLGERSMRLNQLARVSALTQVDTQQTTLMAISTAEPCSRWQSQRLWHGPFGGASGRAVFGELWTIELDLCLH